MIKININETQYSDILKIINGAFKPLNGFMTKEELIAVVEEMRLPSGNIFSLPILFPIYGNSGK